MSRHYRSSQTLSNTARDTASLDQDRTQSIGRRTRKWSRRSRLLLGIVLVMILVDFFTALLLGTRTYELSRQNEILRSDLARSQDELHQAMPELQQLRQDLDELILGKLPHLRKLEYDRVLSLDVGYLKNISFTKIVNRGVLSYEYKLVVQNNTGAMLWPEIQLSLFNELGIQVGSTEIGTANPGALKANSLGISEVRSYSAVFQLTHKNVLPTYFMIRTLGDENSSSTSDSTTQAAGDVR
ncbi:MAG TPA: hypothetical protein PLD30_14100 [Candidatus Competibacteraceae bacterium]|nr:hypothetical protein [Candidatus Competibacteraceae bacterium]